MTRKLSLLAAAVIGLAAVSANAADAAKTWKSKCASCHGVDGKGATDMGKKMKIGDYSTAAWQAAAKDDEMTKAILEGVKREKDGVKQEMDGFAAKGVDAALAGELVKHIRGLKK
jgi:mono/diheme cytochrome c family protein